METNTQEQGTMTNCDTPIIITSGNKKNLYTISPYYKPFVQEVLIPEGLICSRLEKMAHCIAEYYQNRPYIFVVVLKSGFKLFSKLNEYISNLYDCGMYYNCVKYEFVSLRSLSNYQSEENIEVLGLDNLDLRDKEILLVDAICESGLSTSLILKKLEEKSPKSVRVLTLLVKENKTTFTFKLDYVGFLIPAKFIVGYGIDYNENFRDLNHIVVLNDSGLDKYKKKKSIFAQNSFKRATQKETVSMILDGNNENEMDQQIGINASRSLTDISKSEQEQEQENNTEG